MTFIVKYLVIHQYVFCPLQSNPPFRILEALLIVAFIMKLRQKGNSHQVWCMRWLTHDCGVIFGRNITNEQIFVLVFMLLLHENGA